MAELILAVLCLIVGVICALLTLLSLYAGALERAATGSSEGGSAVWLFLIAVAGIGGGVAILVF